MYDFKSLLSAPPVQKYHVCGAENKNIDNIRTTLYFGAFA